MPPSDPAGAKPRRLRQRLFGLVTILLGVVFGLILAEVFAIAWLYVEDGRYTPTAELYQRTQNTFVRDLTNQQSCRYVDALHPHPYLAFVHHANPPCGPANVNNAGLFNADFPTIRPSDRYVVLLTGGSVASQLGQYAPPPAPRFLEEELNRRYVSPNGQPFLVLNGGDGAWKQPQQFILFALYADSVHAVVTLDGYNEHYYFKPGVTQRLESPASNFLEVNPFAARENFGDAAIGYVIGRVAGVLATTPLLAQSHAAYLVIRGIEAVARSRDAFKSDKRTTLPGLFALPRDLAAGSADQAFAVQLDLYRKYTRSIEAMARDKGIRTAYFLQPVPAWGKKLTADETRAAGDLSYGPIYRRIVSGMLVLRDAGLPVFDLGDLLAEQSGAFYADDIHFTLTSTFDSPGYRLMAARMAGLIGETWKLQPRP